MKWLPMGLIVIVLCGCQATTPTVDNVGDDFSKYQDASAVRPVHEIEAYPFGTRQNPVLVHGVQGEWQYLTALKCQDNTPVNFERLGSVESGPYGYILDAFLLSCLVNNEFEEYIVYIDIYHDDLRYSKGVFGLKLAL